ncbi:aldo/keto reductase [Flavobacterium psychrophilum]|uniref:aldo/keto reductase n=1 Tax=Flavobacterium psychrophilum TaxID=96345 RepID=UPI001D06F8D0|nr:aldo/keto reductase [Flavobacterium psychrophilum]EKT3956839.1 aldo/keto reductase [Flavobacterium psychrophilum]EKT4508458.1 aldo/keto reductase [Flavobacterium psychrophilum]MCB6088577.1 aldo/keto reductase [Flavobacterium psychrophilum]
MNKLILGTVQMGLDYGINNSAGKIASDNCYDILSKAFELGIHTLDTAEAYGNAHQIIGGFHTLNPNIRFNVITKIPHDIEVDKIEDKIETYIQDLNVDCLDVLMFHSFDSYKDNQLIIEKLLNFKKQGLIKNIGVSVYTNKQIDALIDDEHIAVVQMPFNLLDNEFLRGSSMQKLKDNNKIIHTRSAFLQGLFFKENFDKTIFEEIATELNQIKDIANFEDTNISNLALSYCLNQNNIDKVLIGVDAVSQLVDNYKALDFKINAESISKINNIKVKNIDLLNPSLWT